jgi:dihydroorotase-like cyclic amidohydrolase
MDVIAQLGGLAMVHAEDGLAIDYLEDKYRDQPQKDVFLKGRPDVLEADAAFRAISIAEFMNCPLYVVYMSATRALDPFLFFGPFQELSVHPLKTQGATGDTPVAKPVSEGIQ